MYKKFILRQYSSVYIEKCSWRWGLCSYWIYDNFNISTKYIRVEVSSQPLKGSKKFNVKDLNKLDKYRLAQKTLNLFNKVIYIKVTKIIEYRYIVICDGKPTIKCEEI